MGLYKKNRLFKQILINGNKISMMIGLNWANDYKQPNPSLYKETVKHHLTV